MMIVQTMTQVKKWAVSRRKSKGRNPEFKSTPEDGTRTRQLT